MWGDLDTGPDTGGERCPVAGDRGHRPGTTGRGQSTIDFVIGFGVFFLTLSFVLVLVPDLLSPFGAQEGPVVADRAVETLASDLLASGTLGVVDTDCTVDFFDETDNGACPFDPTDPTAALLGVSDTHSLNVTLERDVDGDAETEVVSARGPAPPGDTQSVRTARRAVRFDGETHLLELRAW